MSRVRMHDLMRPACASRREDGDLVASTILEGES